MSMVVSIRGGLGLARKHRYKNNTLHTLSTLPNRTALVHFSCKMSSENLNSDTHMDYDDEKQVGF